MTKERRPKFPRAHSPFSIENHTQGLRELLGLGHESDFNIVSIVENLLCQKVKGFSLEVGAGIKLKRVEAYTAFNPPRIVLREDVYERAYKNDTHCRFTVAHELGHLFLHWSFPRPRLAPEAQKPSDPSPSGRIEKEANQFAAAFLMPREVATRIGHPQRLAHVCGVSKQAASYRLHDLWSQYDTLTTEEVRKLFGSEPPISVDTVESSKK
jgi:Zn-dependent peptidase ImmA (M78 family)